MSGAAIAADGRVGRVEITHLNMLLIIARCFYHCNTLGSSMDDRVAEKSLVGRELAKKRQAG
jgi:hypothetical protein